jgi:hypothetical protein
MQALPDAGSDTLPHRLSRERADGAPTSPRRKSLAVNGLRHPSTCRTSTADTQGRCMKRAARMFWNANYHLLTLMQENWQ